VVRPTVAVDVGANYGEVALLGRYGHDRQCVLVEANPVPAAFLKRSVGAHRSHHAMHLVECAATARGDERVELFVDSAWSGTTSLSAHEGATSRVVQGRRLDDIVEGLGLATPDRLVIKIDVEGAELQVLEGASDLLARASNLGMIVECNEEALRRAGASTEQLLEELRRHGDVFQLTSNGRLRPVTSVEAAGKSDVVVLRGTPGDRRKVQLRSALRATAGA
jgi:FkbM family methyltransferase